jgi:RNA polymerase sigma-70 factor (ECF subfamily)
VEKGGWLMVSDDQLLLSYKEGNAGAFEAFVHRYHGPLLGFLIRKLNDVSKAEDMTQETFIKLMRQVKSGDIPSQVKPWVYRVALNLCRDHWRSAGYRSEYCRDEMPDAVAQDTSVVEIYEKQETRKHIIAQLDHLSDVRKNIIILRFYQDLKLKEIADVMDLPVNTVKTHLYKGLKELKKSFEQKKGGSEHEQRFL